MEFLLSENMDQKPDISVFSSLPEIMDFNHNSLGLTAPFSNQSWKALALPGVD